MGFCIVYMVWMVISSSIHIASSIRGGQYDDPVLVHLLNIIYTRRGIHLISQTHIFHIDSSSHFRPQIHFMNILSAHRGIHLISCTHICIYSYLIKSYSLTDYELNMRLACHILPKAFKSLFESHYPC